jgi:four helix bundle protein
MMIRSAKELEVYRKAYELTMRIFRVSQRLPVEERYAPTCQIRRSSRSVCMNLREAWAKRRYEAHFISKLTDCEGENSETDTSRLCRKPSHRPKGARSVGRRCIVADTPARLHCSATIFPCNGCNGCNDATILGQTGTDADLQRHRCNRCIVASLHATMQRSIVARHDATIRGTDSDNSGRQQNPAGQALDRGFRQSHTSLDFARDCGYLSGDEHQELAARCLEIGRMLGSILQKPTPFLSPTQT